MKNRFTLLDLKADCFKIKDNMLDELMHLSVFERKTAELLVDVLNTAKFCDFCHTELVKTSDELCLVCDKALGDRAKEAEDKS